MWISVGRRKELVQLIQTRPLDRDNDPGAGSGSAQLLFPPVSLPEDAAGRRRNGGLLVIRSISGQETERGGIDTIDPARPEPLSN